MSLKSILF